MALGALGKVHAALAGKANSEIVLPEAKAIVFFQAAILVCPRNYVAANELGVLLRSTGMTRNPAACWNTACWSAAVRKIWPT